MATTQYLDLNGLKKYDVLSHAREKLVIVEDKTDSSLAVNLKIYQGAKIDTDGVTILNQPVDGASPIEEIKVPVDKYVKAGKLDVDAVAGTTKLQLFYTTDTTGTADIEVDLSSLGGDVATIKAQVEAWAKDENTAGSIAYMIKEAKTALIGDASTDTSASNTIEGAKKYADAAAQAVSGYAAGETARTVKDVADSLGTAAAADIATTDIVKESTDGNLVSAAQVAKFVKDEVADLAGAMHFIGAATPAQGESDIDAIAKLYPTGETPKAGDFAIITTNGLEYVYNGTDWVKLGDELTYVTKSTTIAGVDLQDNITKAELLTALNVADGAQVNVIEEVKVGGTALAIDSNKAVDVALEASAAEVQLAFANGTLSAALTQAVRDKLDATNGAFVFKGTAASVPTTGSVGDAYLVNNELQLCTVASTDSTNATYTAIAIDKTGVESITGTSFVDASGNALSIKDYIDKLIFVGDQATYDATKATLLPNTFAVITDNSAEVLEPIKESDIEDLFK